MKLYRFLLPILLAGLAGCATTGTTAEGTPPRVVQPSVAGPAGELAAQLGETTVPADKALIYVYRPHRFVGSANVYQIAINGTPVANMKAGTRLLYLVPPGRVTLRGRALPSILNIGLALGLMEKPNIAFEVAAGKAYLIDVKTGFAGGPVFEFVDAATAVKGAKELKPAVAVEPKPDTQ